MLIIPDRNKGFLYGMKNIVTLSWLVCRISRIRNVNYIYIR